jgi:hypothetical protein
MGSLRRPWSAQCSCIARSRSRCRDWADLAWFSTRRARAIRCAATSRHGSVDSTSRRRPRRRLSSPGDASRAKPLATAAGSWKLLDLLEGGAGSGPAGRWCAVCDWRRVRPSTFEWVTGGRFGVAEVTMCDAVASRQRAHSSGEPVPTGSRPFSGGYGRSELAGLYVRVVETLERSAQLAERHSQHNRSKGWLASAGVELERAERAREAARRAARWLRDCSETTLTALLRRAPTPGGPAAVHSES